MTTKIMLFSKEDIEDISFIPFNQNVLVISMTYRATCCNHESITFDIPQNVDEASTFEAWEQIKAMENHLKKNPKCKMIRSFKD